MPIEVTDATLTALLRAWWWPFMRISGFVMTAPIIGTRALPRRIRTLFALLLTALLAPLVKVPPAFTQLELLGAEGLLIAAQQLTVGAALGLVLRLVFMVFEFAGQVVAQQMGLGFAAMVDPASGMTVPVISQFYIVLATLLFFATNAHLQLVTLLADSFTLLPIGMPLARDSLSGIMVWSGELLVLAVLLMLPTVIALLVVNLVFAVMTRSAPQLNVFAISFPITLMFGVLMLLLAMPMLIEGFDATMNNGFTAAYTLLGRN
jgi:flagellar biosynthetic protein FliR